MGLAQLSVAAGCAMLAALSARRTDQPQCGARTAAFAFVVTGALVLIRSVRTGAPLTR